MPASEKHFNILRTCLEEAETREEQDKLLDEWLDLTNLASEWDARQWGFNPDRWCFTYRATMESRISANTGFSKKVDT